MSQREFVIVVDELASHSRLAISASYVALSLLHALKPQGASVRLVNRSGFTPTPSKRSFATTLNSANIARLAQIGLSEAAWFGEAKALPSYGSSVWLNEVEQGYLTDAKTGVSINELSFAQAWRKTPLSSSPKPYHHYCFAKRLAEKGLFQKPTSDQRQIQSTLAYELHVDTGMLLSILIKRFQLLGGLISTVEPTMPAHEFAVHEAANRKKKHHDSLPPFLIDFTEAKTLTQAFTPPATQKPAPSINAAPAVRWVRMELVPGETYAMRDNAVHLNTHTIRSDRVLAHGVVRLTAICTPEADAQAAHTQTSNENARALIGERCVHWHEDAPASEHLLELGHYLSSFDDLWVDPLAVSEAMLSDTLSTLNQALEFSGACFVNRRAAACKRELTQFSQLALTLAQEHELTVADTYARTPTNALAHMQQFFQRTGRLAQAERRLISEQKYLSLFMANKKFAALNVEPPNNNAQESMFVEQDESGADLVGALQRLEQILDSTLEHAVRQQNDLLHASRRRTRVSL